MATETKNLNKLTKNLGKYLDQDQLEQVKKAYFFAQTCVALDFMASAGTLTVIDSSGELRTETCKPYMT